MKGHDCSAHEELFRRHAARLGPRGRAALSRVCAYLDGELGGRERRFVERHLAGCRPCQDFLRGLRGARRALRAASKPRLPGRLRGVLRRRLLSGR
ncbi:MAG: zf-HC2 domain-containing protein [Elusimicrobiota bacterium]